MLMGFYGLCLALVLVMRLAPRSPLGRALLKRTVEEPLRRLAELKSHQLLFWLMMAVLLTVGAEALAMMGGLELATLYLIDLSIYLDAVMATYLLAAMTRGRATWRAMATVLTPRFVRRRAMARHRRVRSARKATGRAANDDDPAPARLAA